MLGPITFPSKKYSIYNPNLSFKRQGILKNPRDTSRYISYSKAVEGVDCNVSPIKISVDVTGLYFPKTIDLSTANQRIDIFSGAKYTVTINNVDYITTMYNSTLTIDTGITEYGIVSIICESETKLIICCATLIGTKEMTINNIKCHFTLDQATDNKVIEYTKKNTLLGEKIKLLQFPFTYPEYIILCSKPDLLVICPKYKSGYSINYYTYYLTTDGITWEELKAPFDIIRCYEDISFRYFKDKYLFKDGYYTTDWRTWNTYSVPETFKDAQQNDVDKGLYPGSRLFTSEYNSTDKLWKFCTTSDGLNWQSFTIPNSDLPHPYLQKINNLYIIENAPWWEGAKCLYVSSDGVTFTKHSLPYNNEYYPTLYFNGYYVKTPYNNNITDNKIMYSTDCKTWKYASLPSTSTLVRYQEPTVFNNKLILHNYSSNSSSSRLYVFTTPTSYTTISLPTSYYGYKDPVCISSMKSLYLDNDICLIPKSSENTVGSVGSSEYVYSTDGTTWKSATLPAPMHYSYSFSCCPITGLIYYVKDGVTGSAHTLTEYANNTDALYIYSSKDGINWEERTDGLPIYKAKTGLLIYLNTIYNSALYYKLVYSFDHCKTTKSININKDYLVKSSVNNIATLGCNILEVNNKLFLFPAPNSNYTIENLKYNYVDRDSFTPPYYFEILELTSKPLYTEVE